MKIEPLKFISPQETLDGINVRNNVKYKACSRGECQKKKKKRRVP